MTTDEKIEYWITISDGDLKVAETLLKNRHNVYTGFMCHQVIEKIFKAGYVKLKNETAPYVHDLPRLAKLADFYDLFSDEQKMFLNTLNPLNIESRYPDYKQQIAKLLTSERTKQIFEQTKLMQQWTKETILLKK
jgi:HEPN domain-containing protein